jgi:hypothetical protein
MIQQLEALAEPIRRPPATHMGVQEVATTLILEAKGKNVVVPLMQPMTLAEVHDYFTKRGKRPACASLSGGVARVNW